MNKAIRILACAAILGSAILTGCNKNAFEGSRNKAVRFSAVASGTQSTKTAYGDDKTEGTTTWQMINWVKGDKIRIHSDNAVHRYHADQHYSDYEIVADPTISGHKSIATIDNAALDNSADAETLSNGEEMKNGLIWSDDADKKFSFWGIYPSTVQNADITVGDNGAVSATLPVSTDLSATADATKYANAQGVVVDAAVEGGYTYQVYDPDMDYAFMTAAASNIPNDTKFDLEFSPAYTAFEINLTTAEGEDAMSLKGISLTGTDDYLAGPFTMTAGDLSTVAATESSASKTVGAVWATGSEKVINATEGVTVTLFAIPKANTGLVTLSVATTDGTAKLKLTQKGSLNPYVFQPGKKYRINLLKVGGSFKYAIELQPLVLPWIGVEEQTSFSENVQAKAFDITGALENTDEWRNTTGVELNALAGKTGPTSNHYEAYDTKEDTFPDYRTFMGYSTTERAAYIEEHPNYYELYYQQRHMLVTGVSNPHFEFTFTPMAPLAGYWTLKPESVGDKGGVEGFTFKIWDGEQWQASGWNTGQIMATEVRIGIWPAADSDPGKEYAMIIKVIFSPNKSGDPSFSADSELQDVHGDGRASYWKFILPVRE